MRVLNNHHMAEKKQLVLVVESTVALASYWHTIVSDYLEKLIRKFCCNGATLNIFSEAASSNFELALVQFNAHGFYTSDRLVQRSGWARNVDQVLQWLSSMNFSGGGFGDAAIAEGLTEVLMMFTATNGTSTGVLQRHCILVAASNPYAPPVYCPPNKSEMQSVWFLYDAEAVAKSFPQSCVSLSVICPKQLPKLKAIYNAGNRNRSATAPAIDTVKNPDYLVLISEGFMEACAALSPSVITNAPLNLFPLQVEVTSVSEPPPTASAAHPAVLSGSGSFPLAGIAQEVQGAGTTLADRGMPQQVQGTQSNNNMGTDLMLAALGIPQKVQGTQSNSNMRTDLSISQPGSNALLSGQSNYVKIWEGELCALPVNLNQAVTITRLEAYRSSTSAGPIAEDWPSRLVIEKLLSLDNMNSIAKKHAWKHECITFRVLNQHGLLVQMQEKKLWSITTLPSHTLTLFMPEKGCRLVGVLFPKDMVDFKPGWGALGWPGNESRC